MELWEARRNKGGRYEELLREIRGERVGGGWGWAWAWADYLPYCEGYWRGAWGINQSTNFNASLSLSFFDLLILLPSPHATVSAPLARRPRFGGSQQIGAAVHRPSQPPKYIMHGIDRPLVSRTPLGSVITVISTAISSALATRRHGRRG
jgi:hypothetical protein